MLIFSGYIIFFLKITFDKFFNIILILISKDNNDKKKLFIIKKLYLLINFFNILLFTFLMKLNLQEIKLKINF